MISAKKIALVGLPNTGKTTLFNELTGLNQRIGNYPGITVDIKKGILKKEGNAIEILDLPGIYNLFPSSADEEIVTEILSNTAHKDYPEAVVVVISALNLKQGLFLLSQVRQLNLPCVLAINQIDRAHKKGITIDFDQLSDTFGVPVVGVSARDKMGIPELKAQFEVKLPNKTYVPYENTKIEEKIRTSIDMVETTSFGELLKKSLDKHYAKSFANFKIKDAIFRYQHIRSILENTVGYKKENASDFTSKLDRLLLQPFFGILFFLFIMLIVFQSVFTLASYPTDWIEMAFNWFSETLGASLPKGILTDLVTQGLLPGIAGVLVFVPQIAILFFFISLMEQSGYMSRVVFLMDRLMQKFGMSGKSVVPLISGAACAIPAILSTRNIENTKERLITIFTTPFITCSARLPVYTVLISLVIPNQVYGIIHLQALVLLGMYVMGVVAVMVTGWALKKWLKSDQKSFLVMELPDYLKPDFKAVGITVWQNVHSFIWNAGKIIVAVSIILYVLSSFGGTAFNEAETHISQQFPTLEGAEYENKLASYKLEHSYLGVMGKTIEPFIQPLGYDWKIGIALISSIAAREVFVGTMAVIYSVGSTEEASIEEKMRDEMNLTTGQPVFNLASGLSLLVFYAFALQCLSTIAVVKKETNSWKWPLIQFAYMSILAYISAFVTYQIFS